MDCLVRRREPFTREAFIILFAIHFNNRETRLTDSQVFDLAISGCVIELRSQNRTEQV